MLSAIEAERRWTWPRIGVLVLKSKLFAALSAVAAFAIQAGLVLPAVAQTVLYNNGPDGNVGYYRVNLGAVVTNSFALPRAATVTNANLTLYAVDDRNPPQQLKWSITTQPLGGRVMGEGFSYLTLLGDPYITRFQFFAWEVGFPIPNLALPPGTYYLQIEDVRTRWATYAFWSQSSDGASEAIYEPIGAHGAGGISQVPSESFSLMGEWSAGAARVR